jgi:hypothetical protein
LDQAERVRNEVLGVQIATKEVARRILRHAIADNVAVDESQINI